MFTYPEKFDIIVIGGGHAGTEAALAAARMNARTLLITQDLDTISQMSCNPSIGGVGKGQIVREIDALGGQMGKTTDIAAINYHMLNTSKGPAVHSPRAQCDKKLYQFTVKRVLESRKNLKIIQDEATDIWISGSQIRGICTLRGTRYEGKILIITAGTFLKGIIHIGLKSFAGGRYYHYPSNHLSKSIKSLGINMGRLKTGTPMRLNGRTINFSVCTEQKSDGKPFSFSLFSQVKKEKYLSCWITKTNAHLAEIIRKNLDKSPLYSGKIKSIGPRYCPSIEDKIVKFPHHESHHIFLEPEGLNTHEYYVNGLSTSLPEEVQIEMVRSIKAMRKAEILRPGYAIEYDFAYPIQLKKNLESKIVENLFMAGQVNGTTGYEEAAAQGLMAVINAVRKLKRKKPLTLSRDEAYIGVMIDDLITKNVDEPYRMFTARAEYRLLLRWQNADLRLIKYGFENGLIAEKHKKNFLAYSALVTELRENPRKKVNAPDITPWSLEMAQREAQIQFDYAPYIERNIKEAEKLKRLEHISIPEDTDYWRLNISLESRQKLQKVMPKTIAQASRIPGIKPSDIQLLIINIEKQYAIKR